VADLLPFIFREEDWQGPPNYSPQDEDEPVEIRSTTDPAEGGNWVATIVDVRIAYGQLDQQHRRMLYRYYFDGWSFDHVGHTEGLTGQQARREIGRAVFQMVDVLGGESPWK
jgi:hypothetical protein